MMTKEERKKWMEDRKEEIREYCKKASQEEPLLPDETPDEAAESWYKCFIKNYEKEQSNCKEIVKNINISKYLDDIRNNDYETMKCIIIKNDTVIDTIAEKGSYAYCDFEHKTIEHGFIKAKELNGELYIVHNHPYTTSAIPSGNLYNHKGKDIWTGDLSALYSMIPKFQTEYKVHCIDYGIVSPCDYYSAKQKNQLDSPTEVEYVSDGVHKIIKIKTEMIKGKYASMDDCEEVI